MHPELPTGQTDRKAADRPSVKTTTRLGKTNRLCKKRSFGQAGKSVFQLLRNRHT